MWKSAARTGRAGTTIEDETGEMKEKRKWIAVAAFFLPKDQF